MVAIYLDENIQRPIKIFAWITVKRDGFVKLLNEIHDMLNVSLIKVAAYYSIYRREKVKLFGWYFIFHTPH